MRLLNALSLSLLLGTPALAGGISCDFTTACEDTNTCSKQPWSMTLVDRGTVFTDLSDGVERDYNVLLKQGGFLHLVRSTDAGSAAFLMLHHDGSVIYTSYVDIGFEHVFTHFGQCSWVG